MPPVTRRLVATITLASAAIVLVAAQPRGRYPIASVPVGDVRIDDAFWSPRMETNRRVTIPHILRQNELTGRVANFARAARKADGAYVGRRFNDTDVYKLIEAASFSLVQHQDPALDSQLDASCGRPR